MNARRKLTPYVAPPGSPPLRDVVASLSQKSAQLRSMDATIVSCIATIEDKLRAARVERIYSVRLPDGADLGWSYDRRKRRWRFVIRTIDDAEELLACEPEERAEVFTCGAMERLMVMTGQRRARP